MTGVLAAVAGAGVVGGLVLVVLGGRRTTRPVSAPRAGRPLRGLLSGAGGGGVGGGGVGGGGRAPGSWWLVWRWPTALGAALVGWLVTGWPVAAAITAVTVLGLPVLLSTGRAAAAAIDRVEAVGEWARRLADVLTVGVGLEQGIVTTARTCPDPLRVEVAALVARLDARWPTEQAIRAFADDLHDATGDLVAATLILAARRRGPGLPRVLAAVADSVADEVATRRRVEAERAKPRATARAVTLITIAVVVVGAFNGSYLRPYGTPLGQLVLAGIAAGFVAALVWMRALTITPPAPRIWARTRHPGAAATLDGVAR